MENQPQVSSVKDIKARMGGIMTLPSGLVVKARNPGGIQAFLASGTIPNTLMAIIQRALNTGEAVNEKQFLNDSGQIDPELMVAMEEMLNHLVVKVVVEPTVHAVPASESQRSDELLYADEIPMDDKQFLFQWISGGTKDLETFRRRQQQGVDNVLKVSSDVQQAQSAAGLIPR